MSNGFNKSKIISVIVAVLAVFLVGILYFWRNSADEGVDTLFDSRKEVEISDGQNIADGDFETYRHSSLGFSFRYPKGFKIASFPDGAGETIVVEKSSEVEPPTVGGSTSAGPASNGFQIYITPFDETGPLTFERIRKEIQDLVVEGPQTVMLGSTSDQVAPTSDVITALVFFSQNESLGKTREAWFVWPNSPEPDGNYLYQITAYASFDAELSKIMATWKFAP